MDNTKLAKALKQAQERVSAIEAKRADVASQLEAARVALERAESEYDAALASAGLGEAVDVNRAKRALDAAKEHCAKLDAAARRLARERQDAVREVHEAERAILAVQIADLDAEGEALYAQAVRALSDIWRAAQSAVDTAHLAPYDRAKAAGLSEGKAALWRTLLAMSRETAHLLTVLERANPSAFAAAGGVTERERDYWLQGVQTLSV